jgi:hypothetical protein
MLSTNLMTAIHLKEPILTGKRPLITSNSRRPKSTQNMCESLRTHGLKDTRAAIGTNGRAIGGKFNLTALFRPEYGVDLTVHERHLMDSESEPKGREQGRQHVRNVRGLAGSGAFLLHEERDYV